MRLFNHISWINREQFPCILPLQHSGTILVLNIYERWRLRPRQCSRLETLLNINCKMVAVDVIGAADNLILVICSSIFILICQHLHNPIRICRWNRGVALNYQWLPATRYLIESWERVYRFCSTTNIQPNVRLITGLLLTTTDFITILASLRSVWWAKG